MPARYLIICAALTTASGALASDKAAKPDKSKSDLVCKTFDETGSLISRRRVCKTPAEWRNERDKILQMETNNCTANFGSACNG